MDLLVALSDPDHPEHEASRTWVGDDYDPMRFDQNDINLRLAAALARRLYFSAISRIPPDEAPHLAPTNMENRDDPQS